VDAVARDGEVLAIGRNELDLAELSGIGLFLDRAKPDWIVNAAAYTSVDQAETDVEQAYLLNEAVPFELARWSAANDAGLVHYSTDYVFDGFRDGSRLETDAAQPLSVYGRSKLAGERRIAAAGATALILRTSWVYHSQGRNFLQTMMRLGQERDELSVVDDQVGVPTAAPWLAEMTVRILQMVQDNPSLLAKRHAEIYHLVPDGGTSWFGFANAIFRQARRMGGDFTVEKIHPISTDQYPLKARRPANSRLDNGKISTAFGLEMPSWQELLDEVLEEVLAVQSAQRTFL